MAKRAMTPSDETKIYQDLKSRLEDKAIGEVEDRAIQAAKTYSAKVAETGVSAIKNPAVQKSIQRAAQATEGALGSKIVTEALGAPAALIGEFAYGVPKLFLDEYNRGQQPYEQVKYVAEFTGPLDKLEPKSLETLSMNDAIRLQQDGFITPNALRQYRQYKEDTKTRGTYDEIKRDQLALANRGGGNT